MFTNLSLIFHFQRGSVSAEGGISSKQTLKSQIPFIRDFKA